ncbi:MAG: tetratricopeptide repeat protein, partial [Verrucomicrobiota bacterium]
MLSVPFGGKARADDIADGRRHAQRASHLSASGKCRQAIGEYDKAIAVLHDPTLLFNRGECHRKLGSVDAALEDYKQFLTDLPSAPNRVEVRARIAEL